jgi:hypothetical protein
MICLQEIAFQFELWEWQRSWPCRNVRAPTCCWRCHKRGRSGSMSSSSFYFSMGTTGDIFFGLLEISDFVFIKIINQIYEF